MINYRILFIILIIFTACSENDSKKNHKVKTDKIIETQIDLKKLKENSNPYAHLRKYQAIIEYNKNIKGEKPKEGSLNPYITLKSMPAEEAPIIDGISDEVWNQAKEIYAYDKAAKLNILIKSLYSLEKSEIYFLVEFNDADESNRHKLWKWDQNEKIYKQSGIREDVFVFKWLMTGNPKDFSIYSDEDHYADIWFWKANRTNPVSYADNKMQILNNLHTKNSTKIISRTGKTRYLNRIGDEGLSSYKNLFPTEYTSEYLERFEIRSPSESRADIKGRGKWENSKWTIEFSRRLITNHSDDIEFYDLDKLYYFGVSRYEIAGRYPISKLSQPLYGCGDINNIIKLEFIKN